MNKTQATENRLFWDKFLEVGRKRRTESEWNKATVLAFSWNTCACGSINDGLPRYGGSGGGIFSPDHNQPLDDTLSDLGGGFHRAVKTSNIRKARTLFNQIQIRAAKVINEL